MLRDAPQTIYLKDYRPPEFLIDTVDLHFDLGEEVVRVKAKLTMRRNPAGGLSDGPLILHGEQLEPISLMLDGSTLDSDAYSIAGDGLTIPEVPERFTLESEVRIRPTEKTALEGLYQSGGMLCTQCEAEGFRRITWFLDRPDVMTRFTTTIDADRARYPVLLSNGNLVESTDTADGRRRVTWADPFPKPSYLFALVAGDLSLIEDSYVTASGRAVALRIYVESENADKCGHAMLSVKNAMAWDESNYGREYDLDVYMIVAVNDFNMGAMENKGLNIFNSKFVLARPDTATDQDFQGIEGVIAHEYFHNWTGNRITCRDWFQLSLKEGLTVYRDQEFSADMGSRGVKRIEDVRMLRAHQFAEDAGPMAHPVRPDSYMEINNFYTVTVYEKGAEVVRMQHTLLGAGAYRQAMDLYFDRFDGQAVTTDDFTDCMAETSGRDLEQFRRWYSQAGTPHLMVSDDFDPAQEVYTLTVRQTCPSTPGQPEKLPFHIPLALGLLDGQGGDIPLCLEGEKEASADVTRVLELRGEVEVFRFTGVRNRPVPSLLRGFSAPVKLSYDYDDENLMFLMAHDSDGFNRWDAAQTLSQRILFRLIEDSAYSFPQSLMDAYRRILKDGTTDKALLAEILTLPSESYLGDQMAQVDVEGIHRARSQLKTEVASQLREDLLAVYRDSQASGPYEIDSDSIARRRLGAVCLGYLMELKEEEIYALCASQYRQGRNMTDVMAALVLIADSDAPQREPLLEEFYGKWKNDPLVLDKWFTVQAVSTRPDTLTRVCSLMNHPDFSIRNPNRVRSLIGAFCSANPIRFHAAGGGGYAFLVDQVLELDRLNPQVAARLLRIMARWNRYDEQRRHLMRDQLQRVLSADGVSRDVYEIATKSLEA